MIEFFTMGGTIDKIYYDRKNTYEIGETILEDILREAHVTRSWRYESLAKKDSLDLTADDRILLSEKIKKSSARWIVVTHGTDTIVTTARMLKGTPDKVIVLTGAMEPARFKSSDATFNIGFAIAAVQILPPGVYIAMNGRVFDPYKVKKNIEMGRFEDI